MKVTYTAPNRSHHFEVASALHHAGVLEKFVTGASRFGRHHLPEGLKEHALRRDEWQTLYLLAVRLGLPFKWKCRLARLSRQRLDRSSLPYARNSDIFQFYNTSGLDTVRRLKSSRTLKVMELVNSHPTNALRTMLEEQRRLGVRERNPFYAPDYAQCLAEIEEADYIICPSTFVENTLVAEGVSRERIVKVPYGTSTLGSLRDCPKSFPVDRPFRFVYVGQICMRKGVRYLIEAFTKVSESLLCSLDIVGAIQRDGGLSNLTIPKNVRFVGIQNRQELALTYEQSDCFVLPTLEEGMALVLSEAMSKALPIVTTTNSGAQDLFSDGGAGFILPIRDVNAMADKMRLLASDRRLYESCSESALRDASVFAQRGSTGNRMVKALEGVNQRQPSSRSRINNLLAE